MGGAFESSIIVKKPDISLFMPVNRATGTTGDTFLSQDFRSILQENIDCDTQRYSKSNSLADNSQDARYVSERRNKIDAQEVHRERIEKNDRQQDSQIERTATKDTQQNTETDDSSAQDASENCAGQDTPKKENGKTDDNSEVDAKQDSDQPTQSKAKKNDEDSGEDVSPDLVVEQIITDVEQPAQGLSDTTPVQITEDVTQEPLEQSSVGEAGEPQTPVADSVTANVQIQQEAQAVVDAGTVSDDSVVAQEQELQQVVTDQSGLELNSDQQKTTELTDGKNVQTEQAVADTTQQETTAEQKSEPAVSTGVSIGQADELSEEALDEDILDQSPEDDSSPHQHVGGDKQLRQEKPSVDKQFEMKETMTQEQQQSQSPELQTDQLKDVTIAQVIQEKAQSTAGPQVLSDSDLKTGIDVVSGSDQLKMKDTVESTQTKQEVASRSQDYRAEEQEIVRQVQAKLNLRTMGDVNQSEIKFNLYPKHLGEVAMKLVMQDSSLIARMKVDNESVKQVLESNMAELRRNLSSQGVKVEKIEVTVKSDTQTMGSFDERRANSHGEQKSNYEYVTNGSHRFKKEGAATAEKSTQKTTYNRQQAVSSDGRLNYLV